MGFVYCFLPPQEDQTQERAESTFTACVELACAVVTPSINLKMVESRRQWTRHGMVGDYAVCMVGDYAVCMVSNYAVCMVVHCLYGGLVTLVPL